MDYVTPTRSACITEPCLIINTFWYDTDIALPGDVVEDEGSLTSIDDYLPHCANVNVILRYHYHASKSEIARKHATMMAIMLIKGALSVELEGVEYNE